MEGLEQQLNSYRSGELRGADVMLRLVRLADRDDIRANFTRHCRDEADHAWRWTRVIQALGFEIAEVEDPYQNYLGSEFGEPRGLVDVLALTLVLEHRGVKQYEDHLDRCDASSDLIRRTLTGILKDERRHISWITKELDDRAKTDPRVSRSVERAFAADERAIARFGDAVGAGLVAF